MTKESIFDQLIRHEGLMLKPYRCTEGKLTIGVGRNLDDVGITKDEAMTLLRNDVSKCMSDCKREIDFFDSLSEDRQNVLINMCFNLGIGGLLKFKRMLDALKREMWIEAADEMLKSKWAEQVGNRAKELTNIVVNG